MYTGSTVNAIILRAAVFCELSLFINLWSGYFSLPLKRLPLGANSVVYFINPEVYGNISWKCVRTYQMKELLRFRFFFVRNTLFPNLLFY